MIRAPNQRRIRAEMVHREPPQHSFDGISLCKRVALSVKGHFCIDIAIGTATRSTGAGADAMEPVPSQPTRPSAEAFTALQTGAVAREGPNLGLLVSSEDLAIYQQGKNRRRAWRDIKLLGTGAEGESLNEETRLRQAGGPSILGRGCWKLAMWARWAVGYWFGTGSFNLRTPRPISFVRPLEVTQCLRTNPKTLADSTERLRDKRHRRLLIWLILTLSSFFLRQSQASPKRRNGRVRRLEINDQTTAPCDHNCIRHDLFDGSSLASPAKGRKGHPEPIPRYALSQWTSQSATLRRVLRDAREVVHPQQALPRRRPHVLRSATRRQIPARIPRAEHHGDPSVDACLFTPLLGRSSGPEADERDAAGPERH